MATGPGSVDTKKPVGSDPGGPPRCSRRRPSSETDGAEHRSGRRIGRQSLERRRARLERQVAHAAGQAATAAARLTSLEADLAMLELEGAP
jgi:hypothetical protein